MLILCRWPVVVCLSSFQRRFRGVNRTPHSFCVTGQCLLPNFLLLQSQRSQLHSPFILCHWPVCFLCGFFGHVLFQFLCNLQQYCNSAYNKLNSLQQKEFINITKMNYIWGKKQKREKETNTHALMHARAHEHTHTRTHTCMHALTRTHTHTHTPVSYTHLTLPTRR